MDKFFRLVRGPWMVAARSSAIDGPRTGLRHVSLPLHQFYFYSSFVSFLLCLCPLAPSPGTMVWIILAPLASSPLGLGLSSTSFDPLLPAADASVSLSLSIPRFPFQAFLTPPGRPPFPWDTCGEPSSRFRSPPPSTKPIHCAPPTRSTHETVRVDARLRSIRARTEGEEARARTRG